MIFECDLLVITDGRLDYLRETVASAHEQLPESAIGRRWMFDDTGDEHHRRQLAEEFPEFIHLGRQHRQGFGGAISAAWADLLANSTAGFVFHLEQDFTFTRPLDLTALMMTLADEAHLVQLALRRQPWNEAERAVGGIVEQHPGDYTERRGTWGTWLEHRRFFTTNPSLYRRSLMGEGWPTGEHSEGHFGIGLLERHPEWRFAFWGSRDSGEAVHHIGHERIGTGY